MDKRPVEDTLHDVFTQHGIASRSDLPQSLIGDLIKWAADECRYAMTTTRATAVQLIAEKHRTNREHKGYTPEHDDEHISGELADAAIAFIMQDLQGIKNAKDWWPFEEDQWNPSDDPIRNLVKAGALIVAEIERRQRIG